MQTGPSAGRCIVTVPVPLVADVLQVLIKADGGVRHPLADGPCPILQYANDTIILLKAEREDITRLRNLLDMFSSATGLAINYDKSTAAPMHLSDFCTAKWAPCLRPTLDFHCQTSSFNYLPSPPPHC